MPDLSAEEYEALRRDIVANGVIVPVVVDQHGRILDGHNRAKIAAKLGIPLPSEMRTVGDDDEAMALAVTLNCARRHLNREQVRTIVAAEIRRRPRDSDRAIARRVGCSPSTVGAVRRPPEVSKLDTSISREEAEQRTGEIRAGLDHLRAQLFHLVCLGLEGGIPVSDLVAALTMARLSTDRRPPPEVAEVFRAAVWDYITEVTLWPETIAAISPTDPLPDEVRAVLLAGIAGLGEFT